MDNRMRPQQERFLPRLLPTLARNLPPHATVPRYPGQSPLSQPMQQQQQQHNQQQQLAPPPAVFASDTVLLECTDELVDDSVMISDAITSSSAPQQSSQQQQQHPLGSSSGSEIAWTINSRSTKTTSQSSSTGSALHSRAGSLTNVNSPPPAAGGDATIINSKAFEDETKWNIEESNQNINHHHATGGALDTLHRQSNQAHQRSLPRHMRPSPLTTSGTTSSSQLIETNRVVANAMVNGSGPLSPNSVMTLASSVQNRMPASPPTEGKNSSTAIPMQAQDTASIMRDIVWITSTTAALPGTGLLESKTSCPPALAILHGAPLGAFSNATRALVTSLLGRLPTSPTAVHANSITANNSAATSPVADTAQQQSSILPVAANIIRSGGPNSPAGAKSNRLILGQLIELTDSASRTPCTYVGRIVRALPTKVLVHYVGRPDGYEEWLDCDSPRIKYTGYSLSELNRAVCPPYGWDERQSGPFEWSKLTAQFFSNDDLPINSSTTTPNGDEKSSSTPPLLFLTRQDYELMRSERQHTAVRQSLRIGNVLEAVDPMCPRAVRTCCIVGASDFRVQLHMLGMPPELDFWLDDASDQVFPPGYAFAHGYTVTPPVPWSTCYDLSASPSTRCSLIGCMGWGHGFGGCYESHSCLTECPYAAFLCGFGLPAIAGDECSRALRCADIDGAKPLTDFHMSFIEQRLPASLLAPVNSTTTAERKAKVDAMQQAIDSKLGQAAAPRHQQYPNVYVSTKSLDVGARLPPSTTVNVGKSNTKSVPKDTSNNIIIISSSANITPRNGHEPAVASTSATAVATFKPSFIGRPRRRMKSKYIKYVRNKRLLESLESRFDACGCLGFSANGPAPVKNAADDNNVTANPLKKRKFTSPASPAETHQNDASSLLVAGEQAISAQHPSVVKGAMTTSPAAYAEAVASFRRRMAPPPTPRTLLDLARLDLHLHAVHCQLSDALRRQTLQRAPDLAEQHAAPSTLLQHIRARNAQGFSLTPIEKAVLVANPILPKNDTQIQQSDKKRETDVRPVVPLDPMTPASSPPPAPNAQGTSKKFVSFGTSGGLAQMMPAAAILNVEHMLQSGHNEHLARMQRMSALNILGRAQTDIEKFLRDGDDDAEGKPDEAAATSVAAPKGNLGLNLLPAFSLSNNQATKDIRQPQPSSSVSGNADPSASLASQTNHRPIILQNLADHHQQMDQQSSISSPSDVKEVHDFLRSHFPPQQRHALSANNVSSINQSSSVS